MLRHIIRCFLIICLMISIIFTARREVFAIYSLPTTVHLLMYVLQNPSGAKVTPFQPCVNGTTSYGCAAPGYSYTFSGSTPDVQVETDYLLSSLPKELSTLLAAPSALRALAIAERSYMAYHVQNNIQMDNSTQFQAYIPYWFVYDGNNVTPNNTTNPCASSNLAPSQILVCKAVSARYYLASTTPSGNDLPARTNFFQDVLNRTTTAGDKPYLIAVDDPISSTCDTTNSSSNHYGMSQRGAARWSRGNQCFSSTSSPWSVRWHKAEQILFHYYTDVHLRIANTTIVSPDKRWNLLKIVNLPTTITSGGNFTIDAQVQNVGVTDWACSPSGTDYGLAYRWTGPQMQTTSKQYLVSLCGVTKGDPSPTKTGLQITVPAWGSGSYTLQFDMVQIIPGTTTSYFSYFSAAPNNWPAYYATVYYISSAVSPYRQLLPVVNQNCNGTCSIPAQ